MVPFRLILFLVLVSEIAVFIVTPLFPLSPNTQSILQAHWQFLQSSIPKTNFVSLFSVIFQNNLVILILDTLPLVGVGFFYFEIVMTGLLLHAGIGSNALLYALALFVIPDTIVEFMAYSFVVASFLFFLYRVIFDRDRLRSDFRYIFFAFVFYLLFGFLISLVLLLTAAVIESAIIVYGIDAIFTWFVTTTILLITFSSKWRNKLTIFFPLDSLRSILTKLYSTNLDTDLYE